MSNKKKQNKNTKKKSVKKKQKKPTYSYYISLEDGNKLPPWFNKWQDGFIKLPMKQREYIDPHSDDPKLSFKFKNHNIGEDKNYNASLSEIVITERITKQDNFLMVFVVDLIMKPSRKKYIDKPLKRVYLEYEILCPIWQED